MLLTEFLGVLCMIEQKLKKLPLGYSDFKRIVDENCVYADKTKLIHKMIHGGGYYFISRPRRFGKSLLISTLGELFSGNKKLFKNLWIASSDYSWPKHPIIRFDFSCIGNLTTEDLITNINVRLDTIARDYKIDVARYPSIDSKFQELIAQLSKINKVVILIDEYDKPILDHIDDTNEAKAQREVLKSLYSVIKGSDQYLRFVLLTGVSKFSKTSIFSGINNLEDITLDREYATLLGYTDQEIKTYFTAHIKVLTRELKQTATQITKELKNNYDGYAFAADSPTVFNPYSVLSCLKKKTFENYWFETGTPTFLIKLIQTNSYPLDLIYQPIMSTRELGAFEPNNIKITALLYQTGYLTITQYNKATRAYTLDFPNYEVASAFNLLLSTSFTQLTEDQTKTYATSIAQAFAAHDLDEFKTQLQSFFDEMPYNTHIKREYDFQIIVFSVFKLIGIEVNPEVATSIGRADLVVSFPKLIYIIELKFDQTAKKALKQICDKKYYEKYLNTGKPITLIGINFNHKTKKISLASQKV